MRVFTWQCDKIKTLNSCPQKSNQEGRAGGRTDDKHAKVIKMLERGRRTTIYFSQNYPINALVKLLIFVCIYILLMLHDAATEKIFRYWNKNNSSSTHPINQIGKIGYDCSYCFQTHFAGRSQFLVFDVKTKNHLITVYHPELIFSRRLVMKNLFPLEALIGVDRSLAF